MLRTVFVLVLFFPAALPFYGQEDKLAVAQGGITGFVSTEAGQAPTGTLVCTKMQPDNSRGIDCRWSVGTDGRFTIDQLPPGSYQVFAISG